MFILRFPIFDILQGETRVKLAHSPEELDLEYAGVEFGDKVSLEIIFIRLGGTITIKAEISTPLKLQCARCLKSFDQEIVSLIELQVKTERAGAAFADFSDDDFAFLNEMNGLIDLRQRVREEILLDIPRIPVCSTECRGIDYKPGHNKATDSRWDTLSNINKEID